ncbi:MCE family protein [Gordonia sp. (in: high G+C Gram-positive bacteria)]|uniref:MCE family protein n=1 Tax=Gordonia sp. (in: high G+C Gram-positive bacteria) TaxID=84139 RepID=UPI003F98BE52
MSFTRTAVKLGVFMTVTAAITAALFVVVGDIRMVPSRQYSAQFGSASGLRTGDDVKAAGVVVGKVVDVRIADGVGDGSARMGAEVDLDVDREVPVTTTTRLAIRYKNLIGDRYVQLESDPAKPGAALPADATIPVRDTSPALDMDALVNGFKPLLQGVDPDQANKLTASVIGVLNGRTEDVGTLVTQVGELSRTIADRDATIGSTVTDLNEVLATVADRDKQFGTLIDQLQHLVSGLSEDRRTITRGLGHIASASDELSDLLAESRPNLTADIDHLRGLAASLNRNTSTVNLLLSKLPETYRLIGRASSYGSFVNFFVCGLAIRYPTLDGGHQDTPMFTAPAGRCH